MSHKLFVYGTLLSDKMILRLLGRIPNHFPATLRDYHRFKVRGAPYPSIFPQEGGSVLVSPDDDNVKGRVLEIDEKERKTLDRYEGSQYMCEEVNVERTNDNGVEIVRALAYRFRDVQNQKS